MDDKQKLVKLGVDLYRGSIDKFSVADTEDALRQALIDLNGGSTTLDYRAIRKHGAAIFEAMEEILEVLLVEGLEQQFAPFVDMRNLAFGDKDYFMVEDYHLFKVATIAGGTGDLRRQRLERQSFTVDTKWKGIKIYEELERFLAGRVNWAFLINKVQRSLQAQISADIYTTLSSAYNALATPYKYTGTFDRTQFNTLVEHIEAITQREAVVYGTKLALQKATPAYVSYNGAAIDQMNKDGFFRVIDGINMVEIKQSIQPGTDNFAIQDNFLLVVPQGEEKIVKMVLEGQPVIRETTSNGQVNADDSIEYEFRKKYGVGVITSTKYGAYILS